MDESLGRKREKRRPACRIQTLTGRRKRKEEEGVRMQDERMEKGDVCSVKLCLEGQGRTLMNHLDEKVLKHE